MVDLRVCQADADIFAYQCCNYEEPLASNVRVLKVYIEQQRILAGAGHINLHLTMGSKAGRYEAATVKEYQANRSNRDPLQQQRVWELRDFMSTYNTKLCTAIPWTDREADDGLSMLQRDINEEAGHTNHSIIMTIDKDLRMVPGLHIHPDTLETNLVTGFDSCYISEATSTKKVLGWGTSFFWHQMLMGDTADNIPGLPKISGTDANTYKPTKKHNPNRNALACGPMLAYACLEGIDNDTDACRRVMSLYKNYYTQTVMLHWNGDTIKTNWGDRFMEQAKLLWMMRSDDFDDYKLFIKEVMA